MSNWVKSHIDEKLDRILGLFRWLLEWKFQLINGRRENGEEKLLKSVPNSMHTHMFTHTYTHRETCLSMD